MRRQFRFVQAHVFCRHGDRTPGTNFFEPDTELAAKEVSTWLTELLTVHNTRKLYAAFPPRVVVGQRRQRDEALGVFGSLTHRGLRQMQALGDSLRRSYANVFPGDKGVDFGHVDITSSNYRRTIHSSQALLGGLLPHYKELFDKPFQEPASFATLDKDGDGWISAEDFEAAIAADIALGHDNFPTVPVKVPLVKQAYINVYPLVSEIAQVMKEMKESLQQSEGMTVLP